MPGEFALSPVLRTCPHCRAELGPDHRFCPKCGRATTGPAAAPAAGNWAAPPAARAAPSAPAELRPGAVFAKEFSLVRKLGEGGMGQVWRAEHVMLRKQVALKLLSPAYCQDRRFRSKFVAEGRVLTALSHPYVREPAPCLFRERARAVDSGWRSC